MPTDSRNQQVDNMKPPRILAFYIVLVFYIGFISTVILIITALQKLLLSYTNINVDEFEVIFVFSQLSYDLGIFY